MAHPLRRRGCLFATLIAWYGCFVHAQEPLAVQPIDPPDAAASPTIVPLPPTTADPRVDELQQQIFDLRRELDELRESERDRDSMEPYEIGKSLGLKASWDHGLEFESMNKDFRVHVGGRTQLDTSWISASGNGLLLPSGQANGSGTGDAVDFRRARLRIDGTLYETAEWAAEFDFVSTVNSNQGLQPNDPLLRNAINAPAPTDVWWAFHELPLVGNLRFGNQKEPLGLEHINSSRFLDFMERASIHDAYTVAFNNGFTPGVSIYDSYLDDDRGLWQVGAYKLTSNPYAFDVSDGAYSVDGRITYLPWYDEAADGRFMCHTAVGVAYRSLEFDRWRIRTRGQIRNGPSALAPLYTDTGILEGDGQAIVVPELAVVHGPWHFQTEYAGSWVTGVRRSGVAVTDSYYSHGGYAELFYFLTGEHRAYEKKSASFGRVVPFENLNLVRTDRGPIITRGAWQVGIRLGYIDLRDGAINGGAVRDLTVGVNWFLNPNMKLQMNYFFADRAIPPPLSQGHINGLGFRFAHDF